MREDVAVAMDFRADAPGFAVATQTAAQGRAASLRARRWIKSVRWLVRAVGRGLPALPAQAFLQAFLERAPDGHGFADAFHP